MTSIVPDLADKQVWFFTGSQHLYGEETLRQVADQSQQIARTLAESADIPVTVVWKPVLTDSAAIRRAALDANADDDVIGIIVWMHTFSPAKMWIAGLTALHKPLLHLHTQANVELPWDTIDFDFMNLNQAAHGDREFGYIATRLGASRKTVVGHVSNPAVTASIGAWARAAAGWDAVQHLKLARFGDNMRFVAVTEGDKTEAEIQFGVQVNTWSVNELADAVNAADRRRHRRVGRPSTRTVTTWPRNCGPAGTGTSPCGTARRSNSACGPSWRPVGSGRSPPPSRTSAPSSSYPGSRCNG